MTDRLDDYRVCKSRALLFLVQDFQTRVENVV
jgi:hypothetical protein